MQPDNRTNRLITAWSKEHQRSDPSTPHTPKTVLRSFLLILLASMRWASRLQTLYYKLWLGSSKCKLLSASLSWPWSCCSYNRIVPIAAIIYLHPISNPRMRTLPIETFQLLARWSGQILMPKMIIGITMCSRCAPGIVNRLEKDLKETWEQDKVEHGWYLNRFSDSFESAWSMIGHLPEQKESISNPAIEELTRELQRLSRDLECSVTRATKPMSKLGRYVASITARSSAFRYDYLILLYYLLTCSSKYASGWEQGNIFPKGKCNPPVGLKFLHNSFSY